MCKSTGRGSQKRHERKLQPFPGIYGSFLPKVNAGWSDSCVYATSAGASLSPCTKPRCRRSPGSVFVSGRVLPGRSQGSHPSRFGCSTPYQMSF